MLDLDAVNKIFLEVTENMPCNFFLMQGTALGAYRDQAFIPYHFDIDLGVLHEDMDVSALDTKFRRMGYERTWVKKPFNTNHGLKLDKEGIHVDIGGWQKHNGFRYLTSSIKEYCIVQPASYIETYETVVFLGRRLLVPHPVEAYLEIEYGSDWRTPKDDSKSKSRRPRKEFLG